MKKRLYKKGWSVDEIAQADIILHKAEKKKHTHIRAVERSLFWSSIAVGFLGTLIASFALIPILVAAGVGWSLASAFIFGCLLGMLITYITKRMQWLKSHHIAISFLVPFAAAFNFALIVGSVNALNRVARVSGEKDPVLVGLLYFIGFLMPYAVFVVYRRMSGKWT